MLESVAWQRGINALGFSIDEAQQQYLCQYLALLKRWNKVYNLTAVRDETQMLPLHLWDSLAVLPYMRSESLLDVGSGAGLPGIPLAIMLPDCQVTVLDTNGKKTRFMQQAALELGLDNVQVVQSRVERWRPTNQFAAIISRAFASIHDFVDSSSRHLQNDGILYAMKGRYPQDELSDLPLGWQVTHSYQLAVPDLAAERHLLEITPTCT